MTGRFLKKEKHLRKGVCKHRKNVHFCRLQGRKPLTPMPLAGGSLRGRGPQKGKRVKETDNVHHMHIELTPEQYATLCAKAKKSGLTKRAFIVRLLEGQEIREKSGNAPRRKSVGFVRKFTG